MRRVMQEIIPNIFLGALCRSEMGSILLSTQRAPLPANPLSCPLF